MTDGSNRMIVHGVTGKRIVGARLEPGLDGKMGVVIEMEDAPPKLLTPLERAYAHNFQDGRVIGVGPLYIAGLIDADRADILEKAEHRFTDGPNRRDDPLGQRYIHYSDLVDLLKT